VKIAPPSLYAYTQSTSHTEDIHRNPDTRNKLNNCSAAASTTWETLIVGPLLLRRSTRNSSVPRNGTDAVFMNEETADTTMPYIRQMWQAGIIFCVTPTVAVQLIGKMFIVSCIFSLTSISLS